MSDEQLKPCPFCGGNILGIINIVSDDAPIRIIAKAVKCNSCGAQGRNSFPIGWAETKREAKDGWNTRKDNKGNSHD